MRHSRLSAVCSHARLIEFGIKEVSDLQPQINRNAPSKERAIKSHSKAF